MTLEKEIWRELIRDYELNNFNPVKAKVKVLPLINNQQQYSATHLIQIQKDLVISLLEKDIPKIHDMMGGGEKKKVVSNIQHKENQLEKER